MADKNSDNLDDLLNSIRNEEEGVPEGLDDLLNDIRSEKVVEDIQESLDEKLTETSDSIMNEIDKLIAEYQNKVKSVRTSATQVKKKIEKKSAALAVIPKRVEQAEEELVDEDIDPEILELLGIDDPTGLDYSDYKSLLKERMVANQMGSGLGLDQGKLRDEFNRVKGKTGKFTVKNQKIKAETFVSSKKKPSSSARVVTPIPLLPGQVDEDIKPERQSFDKTIALIAGKLNNVDNNVQQTVENIRQKDVVEEEQAERDRLDKEDLINQQRENRIERKADLGRVLKNVGKTVKPVTDLLGGFFDFMKRLGFATLIMELLKFLEDPGAYIKGLKEWANGLIKTIEDNIKKTVKNFIILPLNKEIGKFNDGIKDLINKINPVLDKLSFIPGIRKIEEYQTPQVPTVPEDAVDGLELPKFNVESKPTEPLMGEDTPTMREESPASDRALLNTIAYAEGTSGPEGYNTWFGGRTDMDLSKMTINEVVEEQKRRLASGEATYGEYTSAAVGRYQMMYPEQAAVAAGLDPSKALFTPENQDLMVRAKYLEGQAGLTDEEIEGPLTDSTIDKLAPVFASFPNLYGPDSKGRDIQGTSFYGQGGKSATELKERYSQEVERLKPSTPKVDLNLNNSSPPQPANVSMNTNSTNIGQPVDSRTKVTTLTTGSGQNGNVPVSNANDGQTRISSFSAFDRTNRSILSTMSVYGVIG